jgi:hypothetical protein
LLLLILAATLATLSIREGITQSSEENIRLLSVRAEAAALSGVEYGAARALANVCQNPYPSPSTAAAPGLSGFTLRVSCIQLGNGVFEITARAQRGIYGNPDFVQRTDVRHVSALPAPASWKPRYP